MKRVMIALVVAIFMGSPATAMDCGDPLEAGTQAWLESCLFALADDSAFGPMEPFGPDWIVAENQPCQFHNFHSVPVEAITWSGRCANGKFQGEGRMEWQVPSGEVSVYVGSMVDGMGSGWGVFAWPDGRRYEGYWRNNMFHGQGVYTEADGTRHDGQWRNGVLD